VTAKSPSATLPARTVIRLSMTEKIQDAKLNFTGYAAMALVTVLSLTPAQILTVKEIAPVAALPMAMEFHLCASSLVG
jgi:hypothetical protein